MSAASSSSLKGSSSSAVATTNAKERKRIGLPFQAKNALVLVGTYHSILAGLVLRGAKFALKFTTKHHVGCINAVAVCEKFIATSGTDERIFLFTCKNKGNSVSDLGSLAPPAEVRCLSFPTPQFLSCGLSDGSLIVYKTRDWECAFVLHNVHAKAIEGIGFHPAAGKIAVTIGNDRFICVLDMNHGKVITKMRVPIPIHYPRAVFFSKTGKYFFVVLPFVVLVYDSLTAVLCHRMEQTEQQPSDEIHSAVVSGDNLVFIGCEDGSIRCAKIDEKKAAEAVEALLAAQQPAQDAKKPSLASLDKSKQKEVNSDSDSEDSDEEDSEAGSAVDEDDNDEDEDDVEDEVEKKNGDNNKKKITFDKRPRHYTENATADVGKVRKLAKDEGPYLQSSSITEAKLKAKEEKTAGDKAKKAEHQQQHENVPIVNFPIESIFMSVPAELEASQAHATKQCKRKYPTKHDARVRNLIVQPDPAQNVLISADTEGCIVAWKIESGSGVGKNSNPHYLQYLASANTKSHVTAVTTLVQE